MRQKIRAGGGSSRRMSPASHHDLEYLAEIIALFGSNFAKRDAPPFRRGEDHLGEPRCRAASKKHNARPAQGRCRSRPKSRANLTIDGVSAFVAERRDGGPMSLRPSARQIADSFGPGSYRHGRLITLAIAWHHVTYRLSFSPRSPTFMSWFQL